MGAFVKIRLGNKEDSTSIKAIDSSIHSDFGRSKLIDLSLQQGTVRVALDGSEIVGYSIVNYSFFHRLTLEMLMVAETHRGKGIGRALLREAQTKINEDCELWTSTNESNSLMQFLLKSEGFERTGKIENLDLGDPRDCVL